MQLAQKMMLVPAGRVPLEISTLSEFDQAMTNVINNKALSNFEKINLYSRILKKNLTLEERLKGKTIDSLAKEPEIPIKKKIKKEIKRKIAKIEDTDIDISSLFDETIEEKSDIVRTDDIEESPEAIVVWDPISRRARKPLSYEHIYPSSTYTDLPKAKKPKKPKTTKNPK